MDQTVKGLVPRRTEVLITVRAYPEPSKKYRETSCVAGVDLNENKPIRLFPVVARTTDIKKFSVVNVQVARASDSRLESHRIDPDTLRVVREIPPGKGGWTERNLLVEPFRVEPSMERLRSRFKDEKTKAPSLALIRPKVISGIRIEKKDADDWTEEQKQNLNRPSLFDSGEPSRPLQYVPYKLRYQFTCDDPDCKGHDMETLDWEASEALRNWPSKYPGDEWREKIREKFLDFMLTRDTQFFVGTMSAKPWVWSIIGIYYPPKDEQPRNQSLPLVW